MRITLQSAIQHARYLSLNLLPSSVCSRHRDGTGLSECHVCTQACCFSIFSNSHNQGFPRGQCLHPMINRHACMLVIILYGWFTEGWDGSCTVTIKNKLMAGHSNECTSKSLSTCIHDFNNAIAFAKSDWILQTCNYPPMSSVEDREDGCC